MKEAVYSYRGTILQPTQDGFQQIDDAVVQVGVNGQVLAVAPFVEYDLRMHNHLCPLQHDVILPNTVNSHDHAFQPPGIPGELIVEKDGKFSGWLPDTLRQGEYPAKKDPRLAEHMVRARLRDFARAGVGSVVEYATSSVEAAETVLAVAHEIGIRTQVGYVAMDQGVDHIQTGLQTKGSEAVRSTRSLLQNHANKGHYRKIAVIDRFPIAVTSETRRQLAELAREFGVTYETHADEAEGERDIHSKIYSGRSIMQVLIDDGVFEDGSTVGLAHAIHTSLKDMDQIEKFISNRGCTVYVRACPNSNAMLGSHWVTGGKTVEFPLKEWAARGAIITLGTDQGAGRGESIFSEMLYERGRHPVATQPSPVELLRFGTVNGLGAFGLSKTHSTIEVGKPANFVVVKMAGADGFYAVTDHHADLQRTAARVIEGGQHSRNILANFVDGRKIA